MEELLINKKIDNINESEEQKEDYVRKYGSKTNDIFYNSNCLSKLFFYWAFKIIKLANYVSLKPEYMGTLEKYNLSKNYSKFLEEVWEDKNYKEKSSNALLKAVIRANIFNLLIMILFTLSSALMEFSCIYLFRIYIKLYQVDYVPPHEFYSKFNIGLTFLVVKILNTFFMRHASIFQNLIGYKASNQLNCMIFKKVLKASPASTKEKSEEGEIINNLQVDSAKLSMVMTYCPLLFIIPIQITVYTYMLFEFMGLSFLFGFLVLTVFLGINFFIQGRYRVLQKEMLKKKDQRMKITTETFNTLKLLKLYGWEDEFLGRIENARNEELNTYRKIFNIANFNLSLLWFAPVGVSIATIGAYQSLTDHMKIEDIFTGLTIFTSIQEPIRNLPWIFNNILELVVSMKRVEKLLLQDEIDETQIIHDDVTTLSQGISVKIENGNFSWGVTKTKKDLQKDSVKNNKKENQEKNNEKIEIKSQSNCQNTTTSLNDSTNKTYVSLNSDQDEQPNQVHSQQDESNIPKIILKNINLEIYRGEFICIIGEVGSGKSSLLHAVMNNMLQIRQDSKPQVIVNGSLSYVSQTPWIQNDTLKNNILFHSPYEEKKYNYVLDVCELLPDLAILVGGDMTEIGEKGINLSGGQKARISIARAIYAENEIFLFDDPISALDAHVGQNIMKNLIVKDLHNKTRLLVTHALQYLSYADRIIYMENGEISWVGTYEEISSQPFYAEFSTKLKTKNSLENENSSEEEKEEKPKEEKEEKKEIKRITKDEDKEEGIVKKQVYFTYIKYMGGIPILLIVIFVMSTWQTLKGGADLWLTYWTQHQSEENNLKYFFIYASLASFSAVFVYIRVFTLTRSSLKCTKKLHEQMIDKLVHAPINLYHDTIPKGQILNRLSKDLTSLDAMAMFMTGMLFSTFFSFLGSIIICSIIEPYSLIFLPFLFFFGYLITRFYNSANRDLSRLDGVTRSPIINLLAEAIPGAMTIRAFGFSNNYSDKFHSRVDEFQKIRIFSSGTSNWFSMVLDLLSISFFIFLIIFTILFDVYTAQGIGILLTYSLSLQSGLFGLLSVVTNFQNCMICMERCLKYTEIKTEMPRINSIDSNLENWPSEGKIELKNYSVRYRPETNLVLKNLSFNIKGGEKIGVVGRTGSGKSTLCLSLFRILEADQGKIFIDDVDISEVGLKKLRTALTIIPQDPNLMAGTLKYNIDPIGLFSVEQISEVMKIIGFWYICDRDEKGLNQPISENGSNLSVGEKQLICITRAILRV
jgi:ATP-binding cassette subfamily C (CFTR/MRP) protein 1